MPIRRSRNTLVASLTIGVVGGMVGLAFASVPLYQLFCQITGYGGTPARADAKAGGSENADAPLVTVRFDANIADGLGWTFAPEQRAVQVRMGEERLAFYVARNLTDKPLVGTATFNVTPYKAGPYFVKTACFCFEEQILQPGEEVIMPVSFHVDPEMDRDRDVRDVTTITLSYTFYPAKNAEPAGAAAQATKPAG
jgi:cytochrome c oxidase assembly protein subunit 11